MDVRMWDRHVVAEAKRQLRSIAPLRWHEVEQATDIALKMQPPVSGQALLERIMEVAVREWALGMTSCDD